MILTKLISISDLHEKALFGVYVLQPPRNVYVLRSDILNKQ